MDQAVEYRQEALEKGRKELMDAVKCSWKRGMSY